MKFGCQIIYLFIYLILVRLCIWRFYKIVNLVPLFLSEFLKSTRWSKQACFFEWHELNKGDRNLLNFEPTNEKSQQLTYWSSDYKFVFYICPTHWRLLKFCNFQETCNFLEKIYGFFGNFFWCPMIGKLELIKLLSQITSYSSDV